MLAIVCSRKTIRNYSEGTWGKAVRDTKALTVGPVVFMILTRNAGMRMRLYFADSVRKHEEKYPVCILHFLNNWLMEQNQLFWIREIVCMWKGLCEVLLFLLQANAQVQWPFVCDSFKFSILTRGWPWYFCTGYSEVYACLFSFPYSVIVSLLKIVCSEESCQNNLYFCVFFT